MMKTVFLFLFLGFLIFPIVVENAFAEQTEIRFELTYPNGDRGALGNSQLHIMSADKEINLELKGNHSDPYFKTELPIQKKYKIVAYSNDMEVGIKYLQLENKISNVIKIPINPSIGIKFFIYYNDGTTPIENALLKIYSQKGNLIKTTQTDADGKSQRFWLASTISEGDFYRTEISIGEDIFYEYPPIRLSSGSHDFRVVTNWPPTIDYITITASFENSPNIVLNENHLVELYKKEKLEKHAKFYRGSAHISKLNVGEYNVLVYEEKNPQDILASSKISIDGNTNEFKIILNQTSILDDKLDLQKNGTFNSTDSETESLGKFSNLLWSKQSLSGIQKKFESPEYFLALETEGNGNVVFTRSEPFDSMDLSDKKIQLTYKVNNPLSLREFWVYFSNDNFKTSWNTLKIPLNGIPPNTNLTKIFELNETEITGKTDSSKINQIQIRIKDKATETVKLQISDFKIIDSASPHLTTEDRGGKNYFDSCDCVAFRLDDVQDHFLDDVQMEIINSFIENDVKLTVGVIGGKIGDDQKLVSFLKYNKNNPYLKFANHGWDHENFTQFSKEGQEMLILRANDKIKSLFGVEPEVFIPPFNAFNDDTISALESLKFTHFSSELDEETPPFPKSGQKLYRFPETAFTGDLDKEEMKFVGVSHQITLQQINESINKFGFAVVTLHPQEFSNFYDDNYQNEMDSQQFNELKKLFSSLKDKKIPIVFLDEIDSKSSLVPSWVKHNAKWWAEEKINDVSFVSGIQFLIDEKIIHVNSTEKNGPTLTKIPPWVKSNAKWWSEDLLSDEEFVKSIEYLIDQRIINL